MVEKGNDGSQNFVPCWDGRSDSFGHFIVECKWALQSSKANERPLLAARIVRKALQSNHAALVQLMYKLRPEEFKAEKDVAKLIKYLEESPLNKQPLPDAGSKIGGYYRRLSRRPHEGVSAFLIREDKLHDDMVRALQRLLREKELTFEDYDVDVEELRRFCGFSPGQSLYYGEPEGDDPEEGEVPEGATDEEERTETPRESHPGRPFSSKGSTKGRSSHASSSRSSTTSQGDEAKRGKDLLERLMEKGLMPLAALDGIRGWLVLEMAVSSEDDRRLIKAATRNRLAYSEIRQALLGLFEERLQGKGSGKVPGHGGLRSNGSQRAYYQDFETEETYDQNAEHYGFYSEEPYGQDYIAENDEEWQGEENYEAEEWENEEEMDEELLRLHQEQEEHEKNKMELEALLGETDRNLIEARKAVAAGQKDRGWTGTVQQRQPRSTTTYPWKGNPKGRGKGKPQHLGKARTQEGNWVQGGKGKTKFTYGNNYSKGKGKHTKGKGYGSNYSMGMMEVEEEFDDQGMYPLMMAATPASREPCKQSRLPPHQSLVDTGATATAGGKQAVQDLCKALVSSRPNLEVTVFETARPWFRFGNGKWGRALYKVTLKDPFTEVSMSIYALPAVDVPVLIGMKELQHLNCVINCTTGACIIQGRPMTLQKNSKEHLIIDYKEHIFPEHHHDLEPNAGNHVSTTSSKSPSRRVHFCDVEECHVLDIFTLDVMDCEVTNTEEHVVLDCFAFEAASHNLASHLGVTQPLLQHLMPTASDATTLTDPSPALRHGGAAAEGRNSKGRAGGGPGRDSTSHQRSKSGDQKHGGKSQVEDKEQDRVRLYPEGRGGSTRSQSQGPPMALLRSSSTSQPRESVWCMDGMRHLRSKAELHPCHQCARTDHARGPSPECDDGLGAPTIGGLGASDHIHDPSEGNDHHRGQGVPVDQDSEEQGKVRLCQAERLGEECNVLGNSTRSCGDPLGGRRRQLRADQQGGLRAEEEEGVAAVSKSDSE